MPQMSQTSTVTLPMVVYWQENQVTISLESRVPLGADPVDTVKSLNLAVLQKLMQMNGLQLQSFLDEDLPHPTTPPTPPAQNGNGGEHGDNDDDEDEDEAEEKKGEPSLSGLITGIAQGLIEEGQELLDRAQKLGKGMVERSAISRSGHTASSSSDASSTDDLNSIRGKYLFRSPSADNREGTSVICFFRVESVPMSAGATMMAARMMGAGAKDAPASRMYEGDTTLAAVKIINSNLDYLQKSGVPVAAATPNWLNGGTPVWGCGTHGCPVSPPIPVMVDDVDPSCSGNWKLEFTNLPEQSPLLNATGQGVTVLVLDTLPHKEQIAAAAAADASNSLLQDVNTNVTINYVTLPDKVEIPNPEQPATGKDIYGRLVGFPMNDHGTFVAGEIRNLAPGTHVECIRVLNDAGVGTTGILTDALASIQQRLAGDPKAGTPLQLPLVINLSLVTTPPDEELFASGSSYDPDQVYLYRQPLHTVMASLANVGVIFVASSGNDSDPRPDASMALESEWAAPATMGTMNGEMSGGATAAPTATVSAAATAVAVDTAKAAMDLSMARFEARYPAAFAYDHGYVGHPTLTRIPGVIPVGAINGQGAAATYSNYSGSDGINTYGGEIPTPIPNPEVVPLHPKVVTDVVRPIDAIRGVYTSTRYPYLSMDDILDYTMPVPVPVPLHPYPDYPNPDPSPLHNMKQRATWAYWAGTSFATPMISALAARVLEVDGATIGDAMRTQLESAAHQESMWDRLPDGVTATDGYVVGVRQVCDTPESSLGRE